MESSNYIENDVEEEFINNDTLITYENTTELKTLDIIQPLSGMIEVPQINSKVAKTRCVSETEKNLWPLFGDKNKRKPKKEYIREKMIRGFKRTIRICLDGKFPKNKLGEVNFKESKSKKAWLRLRNHINQDSSFFNSIGKTENGPNTDGKARRNEEAPEKSYNNAYCKEFFSDQIVLDGFIIFVELVFAVMDCKLLTSKFDFTPNVHSGKNCNNCVNYWLKLQSYMSHEMISDLFSKETETQLDS